MAPKPEAKEKVEAQKPKKPEDEESKKPTDHNYKSELKANFIDYWKVGCAPLKMLSIGCLIAAYVMYTRVGNHPLIKIGIMMEVAFLTFFFIINILAINRYWTYILWPVSDIVNSAFTIVFLLNELLLTFEKGKPYPLSYLLSLVLIGLAVLFTAMEMFLQFRYLNRKRMKFNFLVLPKKGNKKA